MADMCKLFLAFVIFVGILHVVGLYINILFSGGREKIP